MYLRPVENSGCFVCLRTRLRGTAREVCDHVEAVRGKVYDAAKMISVDEMDRSVPENDVWPLGRHGYNHARAFNRCDSPLVELFE